MFECLIHDSNGQNAIAQQNLTMLKADSIYVDNGTTQTFDCSGGLSCIRRVIEYTIKSGTSTITDAINLRENVPTTIDSCTNIVMTGAGGFISSDDLPNTGYQFDNFLNDCPLNFGTSCNFTFANQQWQQVNADGSYTSIGTVGTVYVVSNANATVNGNNTSLTGTTFH